MEDIFDKPDDFVVTLDDMGLDEDSAGADAIYAALGKGPWIVANVKKWLNGSPTVPGDSILHPLVDFMDSDMGSEQLEDFMAVAREIRKDATGEIQFMLACLEKVASAVSEPLNDVDDIGVLDPSFQRRKNAALLTQVTQLQEQIDELSAQNSDLQDSSRHNAASEKRLAELEDMVRTSDVQLTNDAKEIEALKTELNKNREVLQRVKQQKATLEDECDSKEQMIECLQRQSANESALGTAPRVKVTSVSRGVAANLHTGSKLVHAHCDTSISLYMQLCFTAWTANKAGNKNEEKRLAHEKELVEQAKKEMERDVRELTKEVEQLRSKERAWENDKQRDKQEWERREWEMKRDMERDKQRIEEHNALRMEREKLNWQKLGDAEQSLTRELEKTKEELQKTEARLKEQDSAKSKKTSSKNGSSLGGWSTVCTQSLITEKNRKLVAALQEETKQMQQSSHSYVRTRRVLEVLLAILSVPTLHFVTGLLIDTTFPMEVAA